MLSTSMVVYSILTCEVSFSSDFTSSSVNEKRFVSDVNSSAISAFFALFESGYENVISDIPIFIGTAVFIVASV